MTTTLKPVGSAFAKYKTAPNRHLHKKIDIAAVTVYIVAGGGLVDSAAT